MHFVAFGGGSKRRRELHVKVIFLNISYVLGRNSVHNI